MMTKEQAVALFGSPEELRKALGLKSRHAVYMWPDGHPIPEKHELRIRFVLMPEIGNGKVPRGKAA